MAGVGAVETRLHRAERAAEDLGDVRVGEIFEITQDDHDP